MKGRALSRFTRRHALLALSAATLAPARAQVIVEPPSPLGFPRDHGAHLDARTEWWYITGQLQAPSLKAAVGFQITFFRSRVEPAQSNPSALAARHLVMAHVALSDPSAQRQWHEQRLARAGLGLVDVSTEDTAVHLRDWTLKRQNAAEGSRYTARIEAQAFGLALTLSSTQRVLLQGDEGISRKGPQAGHFSHYYSQPQLAVQGQLTRKDMASGQPLAVTGRAWLDHEWSDAYLPQGAVGWDWIGMNLHDGSALMAFRMRRLDGSTLWAGGTFRSPGRAAQPFPAGEVRFTPGRAWQSPATGARYPVQWWVDTPAGRFEVRARFDAQELDALQSTGTVYWEGLSALWDVHGREVGHGYLEMTGYAGQLSL
jgi:predicted secreted hydrolase